MDALDSYALAKIWTPPDAGDGLRLKWGEVVSIKDNGTVEVKVAGHQSTVTCACWTSAQVGCVVGIICKGAIWIAIASAEGNQTTKIVDFITEQSENRDPAQGWVWDKYASGEVAAQRIVTSTPAGKGKHPDASGWYYGEVPSVSLPTGLFIETPKTATADILQHTNNLYAIDRTNWNATSVYALVVAPNSIGDRTLTILYELKGRWSHAPYQPKTISYRPTIELATDQKLETVWVGSIGPNATITQEGICKYQMLVAYVTSIGQESISQVPVILTRTAQGGRMFLAGTGNAMTTVLNNNWYKVTLEVIDDNTLKTSSANLDLHVLNSAGAVTQGGYVNNRLVMLAAIKGSVEISIEDISPDITYELTAVPVGVGDIFETTNPQDPHKRWAGTAWEPYGAGRVTVGVGSNGDTNYAEPGISGGADRVTLASEQMPSHTHSLSYYTMVMNTGGGGKSGGAPISSGAVVAQGNRDNPTTQTNNPSNTGGGQAHENRMSFVTVYRWKRLPNTGEVQELNLTEITTELKRLNYLNFVYTTEKKDTGRTTDDGYIIWGQVFKGVITAVANADVETTVITGLSSGRVINLWGSWGYGELSNNIYSAMGIGGVWGGSPYRSGSIRRSDGRVGFYTASSSVRTNSPYECFVDWTDGTLR